MERYKIVKEKYVHSGGRKTYYRILVGEENEEIYLTTELFNTKSSAQNYLNKFKKNIRGH